MRFLAILSSLFLQHPLAIAAETEISIRLQGESEMRTCAFSHEADSRHFGKKFVYSCSGNILIVRHENNREWKAVELTPDGESKLAHVELAKAGDTPLFHQNINNRLKPSSVSARLTSLSYLKSILRRLNFYKYPSNPPPNPLPADYFTSEFDPAPNKEIPSATKELIEKIQASFDKTETFLQKALDTSQDIKAMLEDQQLHCKREEKTGEPFAMLGEKIDPPCSYFYCGTINRDGKEYEVLLQHPVSNTAFTQPYFTLSPKDGSSPLLLHSQRTTLMDGTELSSTPHKQPVFNMLFGTFGAGDNSPDLPAGFEPNDFFRRSMTPNFEPDRNYYLSRCKEGKAHELVRSERNWVKSQKEILAKEELVALLDTVDGALAARAFRRNSLPEGVCHYEDSLYLTEAAVKEKANTEEKITLSESNAISEEEADATFLWLAGMKDLPWDYKFDGCHQRAHVMIRRMEERGIKAARIWAMEGTLRPNGMAEGTGWGWHTAPYIWVKKKDGTLERRVMDPSVADKAMKPEDWLNTFRPGTQGNPIITPNPIPFPFHTGIYARTRMYFSEPYATLGGEKNNDLKDLDADAIRTLKEYAKYAREIRIQQGKDPSEVETIQSVEQGNGASP
jgi:hypothetical protein